jgi:hypothetical protein
VFHQLSQEEIVAIVDLMIAKVDDRLKDRDMGLGLLPAAKTLLAERGYDPVLGARPLRRTIQREIEDNLSEKILFGELKAGQIVIVDVKGTGPEAQLAFKGVPEMPDAPPAETGTKAATGGGPTKRRVTPPVRELAPQVPGAPAAGPGQELRTPKTAASHPVSAFQDPVGAENGVTAADLLFAPVRGVTELGIWLREQAGSGTVSTRVTAIGLSGSAPRVGLACPARPLRPGQRCRDPPPAPPGHRAPAPGQGTEAVLGGPGDPVRTGPAAARRAPPPPAPDCLPADPAALAR